MDKILSHFKSSDPLIFEILKNVNLDNWIGGEVLPDKYFVALCRGIVGQQLSKKAAAAIYKKFLTLFNSNKSNINPENILKFSDQSLRDVGLSWAKVSYIKDLAQKVQNCEVFLNDLHKLSEEDVTKELTLIKGIGTWTSEMFLMFTLKRPNIFSFKDLGLKNGIEKVYGIKNPTASQISEIIKKWEPYKTFGSIALWQSLEK
ncbi:DNA-3-methyladenine glycosylase 2 family protein [candidate division WWE3 bacterium CG_4_9_14_0_2_um_filter_35_11]|uniref:DNA-3-methyladenine glycosylase II n=1 Tax=candidate division WWE3 bacterium CG_4_9_14_0_2_um_filter_35_11 TaxID=1975077 RepID=A0A2M8EMD3_UNCKA|nr:MAG: DNA-3-methyladenine glycosylase [candidate division WWE3 bacterium CG10_big_fil_rev_8_21_14_0_10_35_32]PJC23916.1 MAG: DNA-3-methyladenine glycosylase 2 family protein [candidate division WWE3 bacterium CG_4_9_14_0_2_um_filter_35_11]